MDRTWKLERLEVEWIQAYMLTLQVNRKTRLPSYFNTYITSLSFYKYQVVDHLCQSTFDMKIPDGYNTNIENKIQNNLLNLIVRVVELSQSQFKMLVFKISVIKKHLKLIFVMLNSIKTHWMLKIPPSPYPAHILNLK